MLRRKDLSFDRQCSVTRFVYTTWEPVRRCAIINNMSDVLIDRELEIRAHEFVVLSTLMDMPSN